MPVSTAAARTPFFVLIDGSLRIGPKVMSLDAGVECSAIYGFSDKPSYDRFRRNSQLAVKPYPLIKGYLRNQIEAASGHLKLVVIDAAGPSELCLHAVTMEAALEAQASCAANVTTAYRLAFDEVANAYRVQETGDVINV